MISIGVAQTFGEILRLRYVPECHKNVRTAVQISGLGSGQGLLVQCYGPELTRFPIQRIACTRLGKVKTIERSITSCKDKELTEDD